MKAFMRIIVFLAILLSCMSIFGQYNFSGYVSRENQGNAIYLSLVEDYRKTSRIYLEQIISKTTVDSLGFFQFKGDNLLKDNRLYRIHLDGCSDNTNASHFLGTCDSSKSVLFIANNKDTLEFPTSFEEQALCTITSTNPKSSILLEVDALKEEMIFDFLDYRSEANRKLNSDKWFSSLQKFGKNSDEPLVELFIYDFLSDKRNETYTYYLQDITTNQYYDQLLDRLRTNYPNTDFTEQFEAEITTDRQLANFKNTTDWGWKWVTLTLLVLSLGLNLYFLTARKSKARSRTNNLIQKLTPQEQKIVQQILLDKSNKEIASELFVSHSTIKTHINNLYKKLEVSSRQEIVSIFKK
ncbi:response regulator transcription factor [Flagellimonas pacifica]|uniref:Regulatory protein, luxR family n=1 Tax=Flagellimonas pacifica TaxID=1247520 RepID=A0A285M409_9FLAO|nr:LuxR C-terminal-related transcriptional regulator [Allomuricauda parva]SNY91892.1 regulatory protein, luxR family [Allomuricauda parva]